MLMVQDSVISINFSGNAHSGWNFSVPVAEFFGQSPGAIFLVAFSFILVAIVRQDSKV